MENIKGFFRKTSTKIYVVMFSILILGLISICSFVKYYDDLINSYCEKQSHLMIVCNNDCSNELKEKEYIKYAKRTYLLKPDYDYDIFEPSSYIITEYGKTKVEKNNQNTNTYESNSKIGWKNFLINYSYVPIYAASDYGYTIADDETIIIYPDYALSETQKETSKKIIGNTLGLIDDNNKYQFKVKDFIYGNLPTILISDNDFDEIVPKDSYVYQIVLSDYKLKSEAFHDLEKLSIDKRFGVIHINMTSAEAKEQQLMNIVGYLKLFGVIISFLMVIIFTVSVNNVINDEKYNMYLLRILGYNRKNIFINEIINVFLLFILSFVISLFVSIFMLLILNIVININIVVVNIPIIFIIFLSIIMTALIEILMYSIKINKCIKKDYIEF